MGRKLKNLKGFTCILCGAGIGDRDSCELQLIAHLNGISDDKQPMQTCACHLECFESIIFDKSLFYLKEIILFEKEEIEKGN